MRAVPGFEAISFIAVAHILGYGQPVTSGLYLEAAKDINIIQRDIVTNHGPCFNLLVCEPPRLVDEECWAAT